MSRCDWFQSRFDIVCADKFTVDAGDVSQQCLRPEGHAGPHLIKRLDQVGGDYVLWEEDICSVGTCDACDGEDPADNCLVFGVVSAEEAELYIKDPQRI